jgi:splicing factor 3B subunit 3
LELLRPDENGKTQTVFSTEVFGIIRSMAAFRLTGANRDYLALGSDSGRIVILQYDEAVGAFKKVHQETFGKSGVRRIVPGQHLVVDPKGRALMIGALEKTKLVYVLNRDAAANLTISSPLEANKSHVVSFAVAALDRGLENPGFAAIELDYSDADVDSTGEAASLAQKHLTFYELDLGLNHVARRSSEPVDNGANALIAVPGGTDGPGGVLVCAENFVMYVSENDPSKELRAVIPRRNALSADRGVLIVSSAAHKTKRDGFFVLAQSEYGDVYKITLENASGKSVGAGETVANVRLVYFDTMPPCVDMCVLKTGFLFAASELGDHALYQFASLGDDDEHTGESSSTTLVETEQGYQPVFFEPRSFFKAPGANRQAGVAVPDAGPAMPRAARRGDAAALRAVRRRVAFDPQDAQARRRADGDGCESPSRQPQRFVHRQGESIERRRRERLSALKRRVHRGFVHGRDAGASRGRDGGGGERLGFFRRRPHAERI